MAKFVIECPSCGKYAEARTGFFARKKIDCACGYTIHVRTDKLAARKCPHCGNEVVFDQSQGEKARCPVCHEPINTMAEQTKVEEFSCAQCGVRLQASKSASTYTCPVCDFVNDVPERLMAEKIKKDGLASVIKYEGDNETLVWKHPIEDFNLGSQLIVHESQEAVFFRDGQALDLFGPGRYTLETQQLPLLEKVYELPTDTEGTFHSEVYFINLATQMGVKWGTDSKVRLFDPASGLHIELGASGEFNLRVTDSRRLLLKVVGTTGALGQGDLLGGGSTRGIFRALVMTQVKSYLAQVIKESGINVLEIDARLMDLSTALRDKINEGLRDYGVTMPEFFVSRIVTPDDDPNFKRMKEQYAEQYLLVRQEQIRKSEAEAARERKAVEAQTAAQMKIIGAQGEAEALKIQRAAEAEAYRMQAAAEAEEMRMKGYTYQQETARQVGLEAMKNGIGGGEGGRPRRHRRPGGDPGGHGRGHRHDPGGPGGHHRLQRPAGPEHRRHGVRPLRRLGLRLRGKEHYQQILPRAAGQSGRPAQAPADAWDCACGAEGASPANSVPECGAKRPEPKAPDTWDCPACGEKGLTGKFCPQCGARRPEPKAPDTWDCPACGEKGITGKFCPECGKKRGE